MSFDAIEIWTGADHKNALGPHSASLDGNAAIGLVCGYGDIGGFEGELFG